VKAAKPALSVPVAVPSLSAYRPAISAAKEQEMLDSIMLSLNDLSEKAVVQSPPRIPRKRKPSPNPSSSSEHYSLQDSSSNYDPSSDGAEMLFDNAPSELPFKRQRTNSGGTEPNLGEFNNLEVKEEENYDSYFSDFGNDAFMNDLEIDEVPKKPEPKKFEYKFEEDPNKNIKLSDSMPAWLALHSSLKTTDNDSIGMTLKPNTSANTKSSNVLEKNGDFHFYWLDYLEVDGNIYFTGKTRDKQQGIWLSCCVIVESIERNLFIFPRSKCSPHP
jgi:DNA polymerase alpha subunit A